MKYAIKKIQKPVTTYKKALIITFILLAIVYFVGFPKRSVLNLYYCLNPNQNITCYRNKNQKSLPDISEMNPPLGKSIFFHETSCNSFFLGKIFITARQACAVESAARLNPNRQIYLLYVSTGIFNFDNSIESDRYLQAVLSYGNVHIYHLDYGNYTKNTPVEVLFDNWVLESSRYPQSHLSDILRYLTLWKYGGTYLDLDVIVVKSLESFEPNYAGLQMPDSVGAGVINFSPDGFGHELAEICLNDLRSNFKGHKHGYNGPGVISRMLINLCNEDNDKEKWKKGCRGFTVHPINTFYAVSYAKWKRFFLENYKSSVLNLTKNSYIIHFWNKFSADKTDLPVYSKTGYIFYAQKYCPKVYNECDLYF